MSTNGDVLRERFLATPLVTRHLMASTWIVCLLNPIFGVDDLLVASPYDIIRKGQLWRLVTSIAYVPGLINALIMSFVLYRLGSAWEQERGSIRILCYFLLAIVATNVGVCVLAILVAPLAPSVMSPAFLCGPGILSAFLVLITRSSQGYAGASVSILGLFTMPTLYFPLLLLVFFAMFGANPLESAASVGVGYAWARGYLDPVVPSDETLVTMEQWPAAAGLVRARGYVSVAAAGPTLPSTSASGVVNGAGTQPGRDSVNDLIAQLRDHAFAGGRGLEARGTGLARGGRGGDSAGSRRARRRRGSATSRRTEPLLVRQGLRLRGSSSPRRCPRRGPAALPPGRELTDRPRRRVGVRRRRGRRNRRRGRTGADEGGARGGVRAGAREAAAGATG